MPEVEALQDGSLQQLIIRQSVPTAKKAEYERWLRSFHDQLRAKPGFGSVEVVRQEEEGSTRFIVVATFTSLAARNEWLESDELADLRQTLNEVAGSDRSIVEHSGREIWFDLEVKKEAAYWKRVVLTTACVLPTIYLTEWLIGLFGLEMHPVLHQALAVFVLSAMLTWPIMPFAVRLTHSWLMPKNDAD